MFVFFSLWIFRFILSNYVAVFRTLLPYEQVIYNIIFDNTFFYGIASTIVLKKLLQTLNVQVFLSMLVRCLTNAVRFLTNAVRFLRYSSSTSQQFRVVISQHYRIWGILLLSFLIQIISNCECLTNAVRFLFCYLLWFGSFDLNVQVFLSMLVRAKSLNLPLWNRILVLEILRVI